MSFAINPSLTHIDFPESDILEIHRSKGEIQLPDGRFRGHPCQAFICISRAEKTVSATVAIIETVMNSIFVYTSDYSTDQSQDYPKVLAEAEEFTSSFGFVMEKVNLDFSPAMREVIIKGIKAMKAPQKRIKLRSLNSTIHLEKAPPTASVQLPLPPRIDSALEPTEIQAMKKELSSARAVIEKITREKLALAQSASKQIDALKSSLEKASEARRLSEENLRHEIELLKKDRQKAETVCDEAQVNALRGELAEATEKSDALRKSLSKDISGLKEKLAAMEAEKQRLEHQFLTEKDLLSKKLSETAAENESLHTILSEERRASEDKTASINLLERSWKEGQQREEDLCRNFDILKQQIDQLEADLEKYRLQEVTKESLRDRISSLEEEVASLRADSDKSARAGLDMESVEIKLKNLEEAKNDVEAEYIRMANESIEKESRMIEALYHAESEMQRLGRELELQQQIGEMEKTALREEIKQLLRSAGSTAKPATPETALSVTSAVESVPQISTSAKDEEPPPRTEPASQIPESSSPEDNTPDTPINGDNEIVKGLVNEFGSFFSSSGLSSTEFKVDPELSCIEYSDPAEIIAIISSSNSVQAVPDGGGVQKCKGYVIAVKKSGEYRAYLAWYQTESSKVVICTPDQQPADAAECTQILLDAVSYFEIVGFMMEVEDLGSTTKSYNRAIKKVPALVRK